MQAMRVSTSASQCLGGNVAELGGDGQGVHGDGACPPRSESAKSQALRLPTIALALARSLAGGKPLKRVNAPGGASTSW